MKSIKELYRIGTGPSSSHTMGPRKAAEMFLERHPDAASFKVTLYGSLAATGKGHMSHYRHFATHCPGRNCVAAQSLSTVPSERNDICSSG